MVGVSNYRISWGPESTRARLEPFAGVLLEKRLGSHTPISRSFKDFRRPHANGLDGVRAMSLASKKEANPLDERARIDEKIGA